VLLHHYQNSSHSLVVKFLKQWTTWLDITRSAYLLDLQHFECITLGIMADMSTHQRSGQIGRAAATCTRAAVPVEIEYSVGTDVMIRKPLLECPHVEPTHARLVMFHKSGIGKNE